MIFFSVKVEFYKIGLKFQQTNLEEILNFNFYMNAIHIQEEKKKSQWKKCVLYISK